jgi:hypothetical protein
VQSGTGGSAARSAHTALYSPIAAPLPDQNSDSSFLPGTQPEASGTTAGNKVAQTGRTESQLEAAYRRLRRGVARTSRIDDASFQRRCASILFCFRPGSALFLALRRSAGHCRVTYLMRAVGRCTPNGHWSGVALERQVATPESNELEVSPAHPQAWFAPRLEPLVTALRTRAKVPGIYADAWEALEGLAAAVPEWEKPVWLRAVAGLRAICDELTSTALHRTRSYTGSPGACRIREWRSPTLWGAPRAAGPALLIVDLRAPFQFASGAQPQGRQSHRVCGNTGDSISSGLREILARQNAGRSLAHLPERTHTSAVWPRSKGNSLQGNVGGHYLRRR